MEPIHRAAYDGDVAAIDRLVAEDGRRLNAQIPGNFALLDRRLVNGGSPLMLAACKGHDAAVARLLALGADVGLEDARGNAAPHWACTHGDHSSVLALLLDAGTSISPRNSLSFTPLMLAAANNRPRCVALLMDRGGEALDVNARERYGRTALFLTAFCGCSAIVQSLLQAGADPTIRDNDGETALDLARGYARQPCILLLEAAVAEPQRARLLSKARALLDAAHATTKARIDAQTKGHPAAVQQQEAMAAAPVYLKQRVAQAQELPRVSIQHDNDEEERLAACVKYALGLEGGGGVVFEGQEPAVGMLPEVLVELLELLVPKWDPARKGRPLGWEEEEDDGDGDEDEEEQEEEEEDDDDDDDDDGGY